MNDFDLEQKLKAVRVPEREEDYWESLILFALGNPHGL